MIDKILKLALNMYGITFGAACLFFAAVTWYAVQLIATNKYLACYATCDPNTHVIQLSQDICLCSGEQGKLAQKSYHKALLELKKERDEREN